VGSERNLPRGSANLYLLSVETGEKRKLTTPPALFPQGDTSPALSPDGRTLVFSRSVLDTISDLYALELTKDFTPKGEPKRLTFYQGWVPSPAWTADGREIVYATGQWGGVNLWRVSASGSGKPQRVPFVEDGGSPAVSRQGNRMVYERQLDDYNIWRVEVPGGAPTKAGSSGPAVNLISSTRIEHTPALSPDGAKIAFSSNRSGNWEIWVCDSNGSNAVPLTSFGGPFTRYPRWSPNGKQIAFDARPEGQADIYVMNSQGGQPRRVTSNPGNDIMPNWSADGEWLYFTSYRSGELQVWKTRVSGPLPEQAVQITRKGGGSAAASPDGKFVYYGKGSEIWRVPVEGGEESMVLSHGDNWQNFAVLSQGIYFIGLSQPARLRRIQFFSFATGVVTPVVTLSKPVHMGFSASADGRWILYTQIDQEGSDLMLVENFR
jgi:Tol biopolymer transport system component